MNIKRAILTLIALSSACNGSTSSPSNASTAGTTTSGSSAQSGNTAAGNTSGTSSGTTAGVGRAGNAAISGNGSTSGNTAHSDGGDAGPTKTSDGSNENVTLVNPAPGSKLFVGANFWNIDWEGRDSFFKAGVDFQTASNPWRPELLAELAPYAVLRFMDWNDPDNVNSAQGHWDTRPQKTADQKNPIAFEWQIDLCNRTKKDYWVAIPAIASEDYQRKLAQLIKDQLDPSLRVYVEWANEVWNGALGANAYAKQQGEALGLPGGDAAASYQVYASVRMFAAFESVFGKDNPRLVKVLAGQAAWSGPCDAATAALADTTINPKGMKASVYAVAPYLYGGTTQKLRDMLPNVGNGVKQNIDCAAKVGLKVISYEGGNDSSSAGGGCTTLQHDAAMHDIYVDYLNALSDAGLRGPFMQYTLSGDCWGLKQKVGDAASKSPKYQGVVDWVAAHP